MLGKLFSTTSEFEEIHDLSCSENVERSTRISIVLKLYDIAKNIRFVEILFEPSRIFIDFRKG